MTGRRGWITDLVIACYAMAWIAPMPLELLQPYLDRATRDRHMVRPQTARRHRNATVGAATSAEACA